MAKQLVAIYARVSTDKQTVDAQLEELQKYAKRRSWTLYQVFTDQGFSGANTKRPAFQKMLEDAHRKRFDVLLVWKLDRLSRSLKDLVDTLDKLNSCGIGFVSFSDPGLDTLSPTGRLTFQIIGAMAEFERALMSERVKSGLRNAKAKGKVIGRKTVLTPMVKSRIKELKGQGLSNVQVAKRLKISEGSVRRALQQKEKIL
ncbi:recombinase family protein [Desulfatibacillum aliphaticivorans]|uniref:recombinase family protein n=1 Tax=Desulfatibacillum aliphaticivorans TaxID=218208 RepID=UPI000480CBE3|nr:recombinase family protein [Desulfatibacillum aliphaticivorans]